MSINKKLTKGFDINLAGKAKPEVKQVYHPSTFGLCPSDFVGMGRAKALVQEGDQVKAGTPLFIDKQLDAVMYCAPVSGEVIAVKRGEKRKLLEITILADKQVEYESFNKFTVSELDKLTRQQAQTQMLQSGVWPNIIQRPYAVVANPDDTPRDIFISGFDTNPLAPDYNILFKGQERFFSAGVRILKKFTSGKIHLSLNARSEIPAAFAQVSEAQVSKFAGPHPAGNVGVQIHHIKPINKGETVWTIHPYGVIQIGKLFLEGKYDASKIIALVGSEVKEPAYYPTFAGAKVGGLLKDALKTENVRVISGNVLTGHKLDGEGVLGYYDTMLTVIPEDNEPEFLGWILPSAKKLSVHRSFGLLSFLGGKKKEYRLGTNMQGQERAFVLSGVLDNYLPMDIYPVYLLKAIEAEDYDEMEQLGIYEVAEEDFALCEFVDVSKMPIQQMIRKGLDMLRLS